MATFSNVTESRRNVQLLVPTVMFGDTAPVKISWKWRTLLPDMDINKRNNFASDAFSLDISTKLPLGQQISSKLCTMFCNNPRDRVIIDAFGRNGSNSIHFGNYGFNVVTFEEDRDRAEISRHNMTVFDLSSLVTVIQEKCVDNQRNIDSNAILFLDPAWECKDATCIDNIRFSSSKQQSITFVELVKIFSTKLTRIAIKFPPYVDVARFVANLREIGCDFDVLCQDSCLENFVLLCIQFKHIIETSQRHAGHSNCVFPLISADYSLFTSIPVVSQISQDDALLLLHSCSIIRATTGSDISASDMTSIASYIHGSALNSDNCRFIISSSGMDHELLSKHRRTMCNELCSKILVQVGPKVASAVRVLCVSHVPQNALARGIIDALHISQPIITYTSVVSESGSCYFSGDVSGMFDVVVMIDVLPYFITFFDVLTNLNGMVTQTCLCIVIEKEDCHSSFTDPLVECFAASIARPRLCRMERTKLTGSWLKEWLSSNIDVTCTDSQIIDRFSNSSISMADLVSPHSILRNPEGWFAAIYTKSVSVDVRGGGWGRGRHGGRDYGRGR